MSPTRTSINDILTPTDNLMENNVNLNEMKFRRSEEMENQAVTGILSLFTEDTWEETSKKTARQEMALVLSQMRDACILTKSTEDTPEHLMIAHSNEYFNRLINQFESNAPLTVAISGNTFDDMMENLRLIYNAAQNEPYAKEITRRMDIFFQKIEQMASEAMATAKSVGLKSMALGIPCGVGFYLLFIGPALDWDWGEILTWPVFWLIAILCAAAFTTAFQKYVFKS